MLLAAALLPLRLLLLRLLVSAAACCLLLPAGSSPLRRPVPSEIPEKQLFSRISVACGRSQENNFEKSSSRQENTMALKDELVPKPRQKSA